MVLGLLTRQPFLLWLYIFLSTQHRLLRRPLKSAFWFMALLGQHNPEFPSFPGDTLILAEELFSI
jgi:hypothetical protein